MGESFELDSSGPQPAPAGAVSLSASQLPIGVFDSGVGGLTVVASILRHLPEESILYLGDTARLPYGTKSRRTVQSYTRKNVDFLIERGVKAVVVACNTASALALDDFEAEVPVWGVIEPGAETAVAATRGRVGVIATESTIRSGAYAAAIRRLRPEVEVESHACPLFVPLVEEGWHDDPISEQVAQRYLAPLLAARVDTLVLGCTHYPLLKPVIARVVGPEVKLVDSAEAVARKLAHDLESRGLTAAPGEARHHFCVTDGDERFQKLASRLLRGALSEDAEVTLEWVEI